MRRLRIGGCCVVIRVSYIGKNTGPSTSRTKGRTSKVRTLKGWACAVIGSSTNDNHTPIAAMGCSP